MAQTLEEILRDVIGQQIIQLAALTSKVQQLQEQLAALEPSASLPPPSAPTPPSEPHA